MKYLFKNLHELLITAFSKKHQFISDTKIKAKNFEAVVLGWDLLLMPDVYSIWHSKSNMKGGFNFIGYNNEEVDALIELGATQ